MARPPRTEAGEADGDPLPGFVGTRIRAARKRANLRQVDVAERLGTRASYIADLEAGRTNATLAALGRVAAALGVTPGGLLSEIPPEAALAPDDARTKLDRIGEYLRAAIAETGQVSAILQEAYALISESRPGEGQDPAPTL